jgi:hypothetical protein
MRDLGKGCFQPLTDGVDTRFDLERAVRCQFDVGLVEAWNKRKAPLGEDLGAVRRLFGIGRKTHPQISSLRIPSGLPTDTVEVNHPLHLEKRCRIVAAIVELLGDVGVRHRRRCNEVLETNLPGFPADGLRDCVDRQLDGETHAGTGDAPIRRKGWLVGCH